MVPFFGISGGGGIAGGGGGGEGGGLTLVGLHAILRVLPPFRICVRPAPSLTAVLERLAISVEAAAPTSPDGDAAEPSRAHAMVMADVRRSDDVAPSAARKVNVIVVLAAGDCADGLTDHKSSSWFEGRSGVVAVMRRRRKARASIVEGTRAKSWLKAIPPKAGPRSS